MNIWTYLNIILSKAFHIVSLEPRSRHHNSSILVFPNLGAGWWRYSLKSRVHQGRACAKWLQGRNWKMWKGHGRVNRNSVEGQKDLVRLMATNGCLAHSQPHAFGLVTVLLQIVMRIDRLRSVLRRISHLCDCWIFYTFQKSHGHSKQPHSKEFLQKNSEDSHQTQRLHSVSDHCDKFWILFGEVLKLLCSNASRIQA